MANRNFLSQRIYNMHAMAVQLDVQVSIGSSGAPTLVTDASYGIAGITRLSAGVYRIQLQDNYAKLLAFDAKMQSPVSGSSVPGGSFVANTVYQIVTVGTTTAAQWVTAGVPAGITAAPGVVFKAAGIGAGSGTVKALGNSGIAATELIGTSNLMLAPTPSVQNLGGYITFKCIAPTDATTTTMIDTDPASGSIMYARILLSNSSIQ